MSDPCIFMNLFSICHKNVIKSHFFKIYHTVKRPKIKAFPTLLRNNTRFKVIKQGCVLSCFVKCRKACKINGLWISEQFLYFIWFRLFSFICHKICHKIIFKKPRPIVGNGFDYHITFSSFFISFCTRISST